MCDALRPGDMHVVNGNPVVSGHHVVNGNEWEKSAAQHGLPWATLCEETGRVQTLAWVRRQLPAVGLATQAAQARTLACPVRWKCTGAHNMSQAALPVSVEGQLLVVLQGEGMPHAGNPRGSDWHQPLVKRHPCAAGCSMHMAPGGLCPESP